MSQGASPLATITFIFAGQELENARTLDSYRINHENHRIGFFTTSPELREIMDQEDIKFNNCR
jgi:hypothetical protein